MILAAAMLAAASPPAEGPGRYTLQPGQTRFDVKVPEGNYRVTLTPGGGAKASRITVKAEGRWQMVE